jgi:hypothetical protein
MSGFRIEGNTSGNVAEVSVANALKIDGSGVTQPVSISGTIPVSGTLAVTGTFWQATQPVSLTSTTVTGTVAVTESGTWTVQSAISQPTATTGSITSSSGGTSIVSITTLNMGVASVIFSGTYGPATVVAEFTQDGTIWVPAVGTAGAVDVQTSTVVLAANQIAQSDYGIYGSTAFRLRCTAFTSGTINVNIIPTAANIEPAPTVASIVTDGQTFQKLFPMGATYVSNDPVNLFDDTFTSLDTTNRWNAPVFAGGGVTASVTAGNGFMTLGTGTTANGYSYITTQVLFQQAAPGFLVNQSAVNLEFPLIANTYRFWGFGNPAATPTAAAPLIDAIGWEVSTAGKMYAICYATNARQIVQDLSVATGNGFQPADANVHKYILYYRGDLAYWAIDSVDAIVATMPTGALGPVNNTLPKTLMAIAGTTAPSSSGVLTNNSSWLGDTSRSSAQLSDGMFSWRKATVSAAGALKADVSQSVSATSTMTSVASSASSVSLLASNLNRKMLTVFNDSTAVLYLAEGSTASITAYTAQIPAGAFYEAAQPIPTGAISGIWASANGNARITERT